LDALALVTRAEGGPLLTPVFETFTSLHQEAVDAARARNTARSQLLDKHPTLAGAFSQATSADALVRAKGVEAVGEKLRDEPSAAVDEWLAAQATVELHLSRSANEEEEKRRNETRMRKLPE